MFREEYILGAQFIFAENILRAKGHVLRHLFPFYWELEMKRGRKSRQRERAGIFSVEEI